jgi:uncharacterized membrane protein YqjE
MASPHPATEDGAPAGLMQSLRRLADTALGVLQNRLELLVSEIEEERLRAVQLLVWGSAALLFFGFGLLMLTFVVILLFWDTHRLPIAVALGILYFGIAVALAMGARRRARRPRIFSASIEEVAKDRDTLRDV